MKITSVVIQTKKPGEMRYKTVGDWFMVDNEHLVIQVADTGNWVYNILVAVHELCEVIQCVKLGISEKEVTRFDLKNEDDEDPGCHPKAPYHFQHMAAMSVEMIMAVLLGVKWRPYEDSLERAWNKTSSRKNK